MRIYAEGFYQILDDIKDYENVEIYFNFSIIFTACFFKLLRLKFAFVKFKLQLIILTIVLP